MRKIAVAIVIAGLQMFLQGCNGNRSETETLCDHAESVMELYPDSALAILLAHKPSANTGRRDEARYALLLSQAYHKNYIDLRNDSLIRVASEYFSTSHEQYYKMLAYYLHGYVFYNAGRHAESTELMLKVIDLASKMKDTLYLAHAHEMIGYNHKSMLTDAERLAHHRIAAECYNFLNRRNNELHSLHQVASALTATGKNEQSRKLLDSISSILTEEEKTSVLNSKILAIKLYNYVNLCQPYNAIAVFDSLEHMGPHFKITSASYSNVVQAYLKIKDYAKAKHYINIAYATASDSIETLMAQFLDKTYFAATGNYKESLRLTDSLLNKQNSYIGFLLDQSVVKAERDYLKDDLENTRTEAKKTRITLLRTVGALAIVITAILIIMRIITVKKNNLIKNQSFKLGIISKKQDEYEKVLLEREEKTAIWKKQVRQTMSTQLGMLNKSLESYVDYEDKIKSNDGLYVRKLKKHLDEINATTDEIITVVNANNNGLIDRLTLSSAKFKDKDLKLIAMSIAGFSQGAIRVLLGLNKSTFYSFRRRLAVKISLSGVEDEALKNIDFLHNTGSTELGD